MSKKDYLQKAIQWVKRKRCNRIKVNDESEQYDEPTSFNRKNGERTIVPDITAYRLSKKIYVEIAMKVKDIQRLVTKWKLLSTLAARKGGSLYLLAPRGHKAFTERLVRRYDLPNVEVIPLH